LGVYEFSEEYAITFCMDFLIWTININFEFDVKMFKLRLWDTAGSEWFRSLTKEYYSDSCTEIIIYDIIDENFFKSMKNWIEGRLSIICEQK
jgi:GTPase SAR1 family protein